MEDVKHEQKHLCQYFSICGDLSCRIIQRFMTLLIQMGRCGKNVLIIFETCAVEMRGELMVMFENDD